MHYTGKMSGSLFATVYGKEGQIVVDVGGLDINGSLRNDFESKGMKYICVDIEEHHSVDIVIKPGDKLPFDSNSVDIIVSTSCFEHDPVFWMTFKEMCRIIKSDGFIYVNAPTNGPYHCHPGDNWRFYSDAGQALAYWSGVQLSNEEVFPVEIVETFHITPKYDVWMDFVCIWKRCEKKQTEITAPQNTVSSVGPLETHLHAHGIATQKKC
jgi:SAM-dependent methyltransferase